MGTLQHCILDAGDIEIHAIIEYTVDKPSGDGWNEPLDPGGPVLTDVKLLKRTRRLSRDPSGKIIWLWDETPITEPVPAWVEEVLAHCEWEDQVEVDDGPDPDDARDARRDDEMMGY